MTMNFAVIGCGRMGKRRARTIHEHEDAELICVADAISTQAADAGKQFDCPFTDQVDEAVVRQDVDHVVICTPNKFHAEIATTAVENGKHVFCEKPLANTPTAAREMVKAASDNDVTLKVSGNLRYFDSVLKAKELVENGVIGDLHHIRGWIGNDGWQLSDSWFSNVDIIGGGTLLDNGAHLLDIYRWMMGEVENCVGFTSTLHHDVEPLEDNALALFEFRNGTYGFLHSSWTEWDEYMYMEIYGADGYVRVDNRYPTSRVVQGDRTGVQRIYDYSQLPPKSYDREMDHYIQAVKRDLQPIPSGYDGLRAVQMAYGVFKSADTGERINLWDDSDDKFHEQEATGSSQLSVSAIRVDR